jgi:tetratricopeptide (TPR) repeat protein
MGAVSDSVETAAWRRALEFERSGRYRLACELMRDCLRMPHLDPADVHFHLGWCIEADGSDPLAALGHYMNAARLAPAGPLAVNAQYRAGLTALGTGNLDQAISLLESARAACATSPGLQDLQWHASYWLGVCHEADNRILAALDHYEDAARTQEPQLRAEARYRRLQGLLAIGSFTAALRAADELIDSSTDDGRIAQLVALAAEEKRQLLSARSHA